MLKFFSVKLFDPMEREKAFDNENGESFYMKRLDYVLLISVSGSLDVYTNYILFSLVCKDSIKTVLMFPLFFFCTWTWFTYWKFVTFMCAMEFYLLYVGRKWKLIVIIVVHWEWQYIHVFLPSNDNKYMIESN